MKAIKIMNATYKLHTKVGTRMHPALPEGVNNPAVGGVFVAKDDPTAWFTIKEIGKVNGKTSGVHTYNCTGTAATMGLGYWAAGEPRAEYYDYILAGTAEAKEAMRDPKARLRDILLGRRAA